MKNIILTSYSFFPYNNSELSLEVQEVKKGTFQPNNRRKKKKHGFFSRMESGLISKRRKKGRKKLSK